MRQTSCQLLTPEQMYRADAAAIAAGTPGIELMENAGKRVFEAIVLRWSKRPVLVICGPGNNGGDGFVVARLLAEEGWTVRLVLAGEPAALKGDAALAAKSWTGPVAEIDEADVTSAGLIVDGLFGAGLARDIEGELADLITAIDERECPVVAIDVPSGIDGLTGEVRGCAAMASLTVAFFRRKPGHLLLPGRGHCGETVCCDIGIPETAVAADEISHFVNGPALWAGRLPVYRAEGYKYTRGHAVSVSGPSGRTGAARLAAGAALAVGAGLVTVASPKSALAEVAAHLTAVMLREADNAKELRLLLRDRRYNALAIGPGCGVDETTREKVRAVLLTQASIVLDADALTSFADMPDELFAAIKGSDARVVLTPHDGEFRRLFGDTATASKCDAAAAAAERAGAVVVLKGADTVIASPDGRVVINDNAPPTLATAGSGDVLTGMICGLMAQGMPAQDAAAAAVWLHGRAGQLHHGPLSAEDLVTVLPRTLSELRN